MRSGSCVLPKTARDPIVGIPDVTKLDSNIHAGVKYLRFMTDRYFRDLQPSDRHLSRPSAS